MRKAGEQAYRDVRSAQVDVDVTQDMTRRAQDAPPLSEEAPAKAAGRMDRRSKRSRALLREALALEIEAVGIENLTVSGLTERADLNRRTFYSHYRDVYDLVEQCQQEMLDELGELLAQVKGTTLDGLYAALMRGEGWPGAEIVFTFVRDNAQFMSAMLGVKGDPLFQAHLKELVVSQFYERLMTGIDDHVYGTLFNYYVEHSISAQLGVLQRWIETGMKESPAYMARVATALQFIRPGDLYGRPIENEPFALLQLFSGMRGE